MVIFFFMIAAGICVLVMSNTKEKDVYAKAVKQCLVHGQTLINETHELLQTEQFYMDEDGRPVLEPERFVVRIQVEESGSQGELCSMRIFEKDKELAVLHFYRKGASR